MSRKIGTGKGIPDNSPRGVALIMVLLAVLVLSTLTAAIVFTTRAETLSAFNYRIVSQAEYAAWAGIQRAVNYFNSAAYVPVTPANAPGTELPLN